MATFVLVHGAWAGGWGYAGLARALRQAGHDVHIPMLTGLGERSHLATPAIDLSLHIRDVANVLEYENLKDVILCGHSYGGMVITGVSGRMPERIRSLVYIDAFVPQDGQSLWDIADDASRAHYIQGQRDHPGLVDPFPAAVRGRRLTPHPFCTLVEPVRLDGREKSIAGRTYIYADSGKPTIFDQFRDRAAADASWKCATLKSGHVVMADDPDGLLRLLLEEVNRPFSRSGDST